MTRNFETGTAKKLSRRFHIENIKTSRLVDNHQLSIAGAKSKNQFATAWSLIPRMLLGVHGNRPRVGTFNTPWNAPSNPLYAMPELKFIPDTLSDLMDKRAIELYNEAKNTNKRLAVMWSGGIDSTAVLVSLLKNIPSNEHDIIEVILTTSSIYENFIFYSKHIDKKLKQQHYVHVKLNLEFLDRYILLHGDPADCLFGPNMPSDNNQTVQNYQASGSHLQPHSPDTIKVKHPLLSVYKFSFDWNEWYYNKIVHTLNEHQQQDYVSTVSDFWWWNYFNFKWEFSCQRPFFYMRLSDDKDGVPLYKKPIPEAYQRQFAKNTFFNTDKFQQWSYTNLKTLIPRDVSKHKIDVKRYVYEFDRNEIYFATKTKVGTKSPSWALQGTSLLENDSPFYYDKDWIGYKMSKETALLRASARMLMDRYAG